MDYKNEFLDLYSSLIKREGADKLLEYLLSKSCDFFQAPASTKYHNSFEGGLVKHSLNVYTCLKNYLDREIVREQYGLAFSEESIAIVGLLHDLCKINCYKKGTRNVKNEDGVWHAIEVYEFDDKLPYGHGEKSVYIITGFMRLSREEAFAIRYHMGFSSTEDKRNISNAFEMFPLSFALSTADMEATYLLESKS
jgi:hypothetical protein